MSASFYDLLKYAKTGIAAPDMTAYDKMRAVAMGGGGAIKTLTGVPPLSFRANGKPLISWSMLGNSQQSGTPAPDAPIMPQCVGVNDGGNWKIPITCAGQTVPIYLGQTQTMRRIKKLVLTGDESWYKSNVSGGSRAYFAMATGDISVENAIKCTHFETKPIYTSNDNIGITIIANQGGIRVRTSDSETKSASDFKSYLATQYTAGTPVTVWYVLATPTTGIVNEPLMKIGTYADELHSTDAAVTIPTARGRNTLTVDTELQPSEMTITYRG